jgi:hypothetical protein
MAYAIADSKHWMCEIRCKTHVKLEAIACHKHFNSAWMDLSQSQFRCVGNSCLNLYLGFVAPLPLPCSNGMTVVAEENRAKNSHCPPKQRAAKIEISPGRRRVAQLVRALP